MSPKQAINIMKSWVSKSGIIENTWNEIAVPTNRLKSLFNGSRFL